MIRLQLPGRYSAPKFEAQAISSDNRWLAIASENSQVALIDISSGNLAARIPAAVGQVIDLEFSRDSSRLLVIGSSDQKLFDVKLGKEITMSLEQQNGDLGIVITSRNGKWTVQSLQPHFRTENQQQLSVGDELIGIGEGYSGPVISLLGLSEELVQKKLMGPVETQVQIEFIPLGQQKKQLLRARRSLPQAEIAQSHRPVTPNLFAENMTCYFLDGFHTFSNASNGRVVRSLMPENIDQRRGTPALSRDGQWYAFLGKIVGTDNFAIEVFEVKTGQRIAKIDNVRSYLPSSGNMMTRPYFYGMRFSPDNSQILVGAWDRISVYDIANQSYVSSFDLRCELPDALRITPQAKPPHSSLMQQALVENATGYDIRPATGELLVNTFDLSCRGQLATGTYQGKLTLWDMHLGTTLHSFADLPSATLDHVEFSPNGEWLTFYLAGELHLVLVNSIGFTPANN